MVLKRCPRDNRLQKVKSCFRDYTESNGLNELGDSATLKWSDIYRTTHKCVCVCVCVCVCAGRCSLPSHNILGWCTKTKAAAYGYTQ